MTIGPDSKKIKESIKQTNSSQKENNKATIFRELSGDVSYYIDKKLNAKPSYISAPQKAKPFTNSNHELDRATALELLKRLNKGKTNLEALNKNALKKYNEKEIDSFLSQELPKLTSASIVYNYNDKFSTIKPFEKWSTNFSFIENHNVAFTSYDPVTMSSLANKNKSDYAEYFTTDGFTLAEAFRNKTNETLSKYSADADNVLIIQQLDLAQDTNALKEFTKATTESKNKEILKHTKYVFWGSNKATKKNRVIQTGTSVAKADAEVAPRSKSKTLMEESDPLINNFKEDPAAGYGVIHVLDEGDNNSEIVSVIPEFLKYLEKIEVNNKPSYKLRHGGALSKNAIAAANRAIGNLTIENTTWKSYKQNDFIAWDEGKPHITHAFDVDYGRWFGGLPVGEGFIGDVIYKMYRDASTNNHFSTSFGRSINNSHKTGFMIKSEMDLQTTASFNLKEAVIDRKLHVATSIGFTMYSKKGRRTTGTISSSNETIPSNTNHSLFAIGRIASMNKLIKSEATDHTYVNSAIRDIIASGPDFMTNMYDIYIIKSNDTGKVEKLLSLSTAPKVYKKFYTDGSSNPEAKLIAEGLPTTTKSMLDLYSDFTTRVTSVAIPDLKSDTIEYSFLNQRYIVPGYKLQHDFNSALTFEMDNGLEYMRLFNRMAGLANRYITSNGDTTQPENSEKDLGYRPSRVHNENQKYSILVKILPGNMFYNKDDTLKRYFIFEDVLFTGGGDVSFNQSNSDLVTATFTFIYKNLAIGEFPDNTNLLFADETNRIKHTEAIGYMPALQQSWVMNRDNLEADVTAAYNTINK